MENEKTESKLYLNYAVITGVIMIVIFVLYYILNLITNPKMGFIPLLIFVGLIIYTQITYAKSLDGNITYGNLFAAGFKTVCAATGIYLVFMILFLWLVPDYKTQMLDFQRQTLITKGMAADQVDTSMAFIKKTFNVFAIGGALLIDLIVGVIAALIGAAIAKKNPKPQLDQF